MATVLLLGDITGRSRVALRMLSAVLEEASHEVLMLPTALISNTLNLGRHEQLDTTDYLLRSLRAWEELGFAYDCAHVGYVTGIDQAKALCKEADNLRGRGVRVILDPILGDNGKKYNSVSPEQVEAFRLLAAHADLITPNMTEACLLAGAAYEGANAPELARALSAGGASVLITSARDSGGRDAIVGYDCAKGEMICLPFERVPGHHWGTGDLFAGLLIDALAKGESLSAAAWEAGMRVGRQLRGEESSLLPRQ